MVTCHRVNTRNLDVRNMRKWIFSIWTTNNVNQTIFTKLDITNTVYKLLKGLLLVVVVSKTWIKSRSSKLK